jgi:hypothetical protein
VKENREMNVDEVKQGDPIVEAVNRRMPENPIQYSDDDFARLKVKINTLLWEELPSTTTLGSAERRACRIMQIIIDAEHK